MAQAKAKSLGTTGKNLSKWNGHESWNADQFSRHFYNTMSTYRLELSNKDYKPLVLKWMKSKDYSIEDIDRVKKIKDSHFSGTMGGLSAALLSGMPEVREDFNHGKNSADWLIKAIGDVILTSSNDQPEINEENDKPVEKVVVNIQERLNEMAGRMTEEIDQAIDSFIENPDGFEPKAFKVLNLLKGKQAKAAHARIIRDFYKDSYNEITEVVSGKCEQLNEAYSHLNKRQVRKLFDFYQEVLNSCEMIMQEAKVNKKPRAKKSVPAEKLVSKLKFCKTDEQFKLVSINPADIVGSKELWVFNRKTRKLGKYIAEDYRELGIKGTSVVGFNPNTSVQKTLRKPLDQLKEFKEAGKVQLRKFIEDIKATDIKLNGRVNEDVILLKASK